MFQGKLLLRFRVTNHHIISRFAINIKFNIQQINTQTHTDKRTHVLGSIKFSFAQNSDQIKTIHTIIRYCTNVSLLKKTVCPSYFSVSLFVFLADVIKYRSLACKKIAHLAPLPIKQTETTYSLSRSRSRAKKKHNHNSHISYSPHTAIDPYYYINDECARA